MSIHYSTANYFNFFGHTLQGVRAPTWFRLLWNNRNAIDVKYLPKLAVLSAPILLNYPIQLYESYRFDSAIKATKITSPIFILGHYRSGTTLLHELLCTHEEFGFCNTNQTLNPLTFLTTGKLTRSLIQTFIPSTRPMDNMLLGVDKPMEEEFALACMTIASLAHSFYFPSNAHQIFDHAVLMQDDSMKKEWSMQYEYFIKKIASINPNKTLLLKSPGNTGRVAELLTLFPDARFIHIHRNPFEVYKSTVHLYNNLLPLHGFGRVDDKFVSNFIISSYQKIYKKYIEDIKELSSSQLIEIPYDRFVANPIDEISTIYEQLNIQNWSNSESQIKAEIQNRKNYQTNSHRPLEEKLETEIKSKWQFMFDKYNYES